MPEASAAWMVRRLSSSFTSRLLTPAIGQQPSGDKDPFALRRAAPPEALRSTLLLAAGGCGLAILALGLGPLLDRMPAGMLRDGNEDVAGKKNRGYIEIRNWEDGT